MGCGEKTAKFFMFIINIIFWIGGAALLGIGLWLLLADSPLDFFDKMTISNPKDDPLWSVAIYVIIAVGAVIFIVGFIGFCGACVGNQCLIFTYIILVVIILLAEVVGGILMVVYASSIKSSLEDEMKEGLQKNYYNETAVNGDSVAWNAMQKELECCGAYNYEDYMNSAFTNMTKQEVPYTCCDIDIDDDDFDDKYNQCRMEAKGDKTEYEYLYPKGCYWSMSKWVNDHSVIIYGVAFGFLAVLILALICACCLRNTVSGAEKVY